MILFAEDPATRLDRRVGFAIVGAGPVGLTLARCLPGRSLVIEAGNAGQSRRGPARHEARNEARNEARHETCREAGHESGDLHAGLPYADRTARAAGIGGSASLWGGYCASLDPDDLAARDWLPFSGWPIGERDLARHVPGAAWRLGTRAHPRPDEVAKARGIDLPGDGLAWSAWVMAVETCRFDAEWWHAGADTDDIVLGAQATEIVMQDERAVGLRLRTVNGREGLIRAQTVILAGGGIETPRLLLASGRSGRVPGNAGGWVGRAFMEHPHYRIDGVELVRSALVEASATRWRHEDCDTALAFGLDPSIRRDRRLLNGRAHAFRSADMGPDAAPRLGLMMEQAPNRDSRVRLGGGRDRFGMPRPVVDWHLSRLDLRSALETARLVSGFLADLGHARITGTPRPSARSYCCHQLGTTRMSLDPRDGVVDPGLRVHGTENLYVAGGSVFPTAGWANPTLTAVALALRLAGRFGHRSWHASSRARPGQATGMNGTRAKPS